MRPALTPVLSLVILATPCDCEARQAKVAPAPTFNKAVLAYCAKHVGKKVGSGECSHLAVEALRVAGAEFVATAGKGGPARGAPVWGALVRSLEWNGKVTVAGGPKAPCLPGDVIQYGKATFSNGQSAPQHTSVVAAVDDKGLPSEVYEQNAQGRRTVARAKLDFAALNGGWLRVYRPVRPGPKAPLRFTLLNRIDREATVMLDGSRAKLGPYDSAGGFITVQSSGLPTLSVGAKAIRARNRAAYEVILLKNGKLSIREVK